MKENKISNFHTHTQLCNHAIGLPLDYVLEAEKQGCSELGISDHCPYPNAFGFQWDSCRMKVSQIDEYVQMVRNASTKVDFPVYLGFECEYDRNFINWYKDELIGRCNADYLVFGPHWVVTGNERPYAPEFNRDKKLLFRYTDQVIEGIQSGIYNFLAHPDLFMLGWKEWDEDAQSCLKAILQAAVDSHLPIEINGVGIGRDLIDTSKGPRYGYPYKEFWELVANTDVKVLCNSDAHQPENVIYMARKARELAKEFGITPIDSIF